MTKQGWSAHPWGLVAIVSVSVALGLRLWGARHGLPLIFNPDEASHFVPKAVHFFTRGYKPNYYVNPPGFTYVLHVIFAAWFGGRDDVLETWRTTPNGLYLVARMTSALLGALAVGLLYFVGKRIFDARVGAVAAALLATAFLPVSYGHQATNDSAQLAPLVLSLLGTAGILTRGHLRHYLLAGIGLGLAAGVKYPSGIVILPLLTAAAARLAAPGERGKMALRIGAAGVAAAISFVVVVPGVILETDTFLHDIRPLPSVTGEATPKLGQAKQNGVLYYLWTLTWGIGWLPTLFALAGAGLLARTWPRAASVLVPTPILFLVFLGIQRIYLARYVIPVFPFVALLAAYGVLRITSLIARDRRRLAGGLAIAGLGALVVQGSVHSIHADIVLTRQDTRELARDWMVENVPRGTTIVFEPIAPAAWLADPEARLARRSVRWGQTPRNPRWIPYDLQTSLRRLVAAGIVHERDLPLGYLPRYITSSTYLTYLRPALLDQYVRDAACWVVTGGSGRAFADPDRLPAAVAYYRALEKRAARVYHIDPHDRHTASPQFNYDWSSNYYPLSYHRPGPEITVYRLTGGGC